MVQSMPRLCEGGKLSRVVALLNIEGQSLVGTPHLSGKGICLKMVVNATEYGATKCIDNENV